MARRGDGIYLWRLVSFGASSAGEVGYNAIDSDQLQYSA